MDEELKAEDITLVPLEVIERRFDELIVKLHDELEKTPWWNIKRKLFLRGAMGCTLHERMHLELLREIAPKVKKEIEDVR